MTHGTKSAALSIGFSYLSGLAKELEMASKASDWKLIDEKHPAFMAEYKAALDAISQAFEG